MIKIILLVWVILELCIHIGILCNSDFRNWFKRIKKEQLKNKLKVLDKPFEFTKRMQWSFITWIILLIILLMI